MRKGSVSVYKSTYCRTLLVSPLDIVIVKGTLCYYSNERSLENNET